MRLKPPSRRAAGARVAFVAGGGRVVEVVAAGPLQQVAAGRRLVAQLPAGAGEQRPREQRPVAANGRVGGEVAVADQRADPQAALRGRLDAVEVEPVDVDQPVRRHHLELHQVEQVGAAGDEGCARSGGGRRRTAVGGART